MLSFYNWIFGDRIFLSMLAFVFKESNVCYFKNKALSFFWDDVLEANCMEGKHMLLKNTRD